MRVTLVGTQARRRLLRPQLPAGIEVVAEAAGLGEARALGVAVDAYVVAAADQDVRDGLESTGELVEPLTPRETQVLALVADGLPNKAIAMRLGIADETVKFHLASVLGKLGAANRTDAVRRALRGGLVPL